MYEDRRTGKKMDERQGKMTVEGQKEGRKEGRKGGREGGMKSDYFQSYAEYLCQVPPNIANSGGLEGGALMSRGRRKFPFPRLSFHIF